MNIVRKINSRLSSAGADSGVQCSPEAQEVAEDGATSSGGGGPWEGAALPTDRILAVMHLRKLFSNLLRNPPPPRDIDQKLFPVVALFAKLTSMFTPAEFVDKFKEVSQLTTWIGRHLVQEIRRRASSQSTPTAAIAIFTYFKMPAHNQADYDHYGWLLLHSLSYLLSSGCEAVKAAACKASLPSTLVKSLYLFFDLPDMTALSISAEDCEAVRQVFLQLLRHMMHTTAGTEELIRKDDLLLLFSGASSWCPEHNRIWRSSTVDLLMILCSSIRMSFVLNYVHAKKAVSMFVSNVRQLQEATLSERVEMIGCLLCILKDSALSSDTLLNDFAEVKGYQFLTDFIVDNEECSAREEQDALRNLLFMISSLVTSHFAELKSPVSNALFTLPGFELPQPAGDGRSVKNLKAFEVLENVFLRSRQNYVLSSVLDVVHSIICADPANYFILEPRSFLGRFVETLDTKSDEIRQKVLDLVEYVPFHLNFIPSKELIAISMLVQTERNYDSILIILQSLSRILHHNPIMKDVFREVGLLEVLTSLLLNFSYLVEADTDLTDVQWNTFVSMAGILTHLLKHSNANANVFRECGGSKSMLIMFEHDRTRPLALIIMQQLLTNLNCEDDLVRMLALLNSSVLVPVMPKIELLRSLSAVLRESHRVRMAFRRVGGYLYLISLLVNMEAAFKECSDDLIDLLELLRLVFKTLTFSMRFEPANARFFATEIKYSSLTDSLRLLGCFERSEKLTMVTADDEKSKEQTNDVLRRLYGIFTWKIEDRKPFPDESLPRCIAIICYIVRLLYNMAFDSFDRFEFCSENGGCPDAGKEKHGSNSTQLIIPPVSNDLILVHPGAIICMTELLLYIHHEDGNATLGMQIYLLEVLRSAVRSERNQQVMCQEGLPALLVKVGAPIFLQEEHPLLPPFFYVFERLAAQCMEPNELRSFLRLADPLCCADFDGDDSKDVEGCGGPVALSRVKTLVSMMTPRDLRLSWMNVNPPFIEFDMSIEGFGCLLLPSVAPMGSPMMPYGSPSPRMLHTGSLESSSNFSAATGGLGCGERLFPPLTGLTFMCWMYVEQFSGSASDAHPLRLFCVTRSVLSELASVQKSLENLSFTELALLQIQLSPMDRALLIATYETDTPGADLDRDIGNPDAFVHVSVDELKREKQWNHLALIFNRSVLKNSSVCIYVNGQLHSTHHIHYIAQTMNSVGKPITHAAINATVGTPPGPFRKQSSLRWRLGTTYLIEEGLPAYMITEAYALGPHYTGSFQSPFLASGQALPSMIPEEKISFGLHATANSTMTLSRLRKVYNKVDSRAVAKMLGISHHENITPVRILHNAAAHLNGPARTLGAIVIGYLGMRTFCPKPVSKLLESVGGVACLIELVALAADTEALYASVKALFCAVKTNQMLSLHMNQIRGYQILAMILKKKSQFLNSHILYLLFSLVGTLDATRETVTIPNVQAFEDMFSDVLVWSQISVDLQRMLYEHFYQLITDSSSQAENLSIVRQAGLLSRILQTLAYDRRLLWVTKDVVFNLIAAILQPIADDLSLLRFGHFVVSTVCVRGVESEASLPFDVRDVQVELFKQEYDADDARQVAMYNIYVRNRCLNILLNMLLHTSGKLNMQLCENVARVLGFDWIFAFLSPGCHGGTVWSALQILLALTKHPTLMQKFKEGSGNGHWLSEAEIVVENRAAVLLGFSVSARGGAVGSSCDLNPEICNLPGYSALQLLLPNHASLSGCFLAMLSLLVGQPAKNCLPCIREFDLDTIWSFIFAVSSTQSVTDVISKSVLSLQATGPLLAMVRRCIFENSGAPWCENYPTTMLQFFTYFYHNVQEFSCYAQTEDFVVPLALTLFTDADMTPPQTAKKEPGKSPHPATKLVIDLLRNIIIDSFSCGVLSKGDSVIDLLINLTPDSCDDSEYQRFITSLFSAVMLHVVASDVLVNGNVSSSLTPSFITRTSYGSLAANVFYFTSRLVDCVWNGSFLQNNNDVFDYILKLINQVKRRTGPGVPYDSLYSSLNRFLLFILSRACDSVQVQTCIRECLCKIISNRGVIFSSANNDSEFFACLIHLLFFLTYPKHTAFMVVAEDGDVTKLIDEDTCKQWAANVTIIMSLSTKIWEETFLTKKQVVEEVLGTPLIPEIGASRALASESAGRIWQNFVSNEVKGCSSKDAQQIHAQLQSKIQKVTGGLQRLASRKGARCTNTVRSTVSYQTLTVWMKVHISLIQELVELQYSQYQQWHEHTEKWCLDEWCAIEQELMRERGLWGPMRSSMLDKYMLDSTEGPCRKRKKLIINPAFYVNYPYRPNQEQKISKCKLASSRHSQLYYEKMNLRRNRFMDPRIIDLNQSAPSKLDDEVFLLTDVADVNATIMRKYNKSASASQSVADDEDASGHPSVAGNKSPVDKSADSLGEASPDHVSGKPAGPMPAEGTPPVDAQVSSVPRAPAPEVFSTRGPDNQTLLRLLEEGEELNSMFRCARINGLDTTEGLLLFGRDHYYVIDGFTLLKTREIRDLDFLPEELHCPIVPYIANGMTRTRGRKKLCSKFAYEDIRECQKRRYLLQPIAIEVFSADGRNYLLAFPKKMRNSVYSKFLASAKRLTDSANQSVSGQKSGIDVEQGAGFLNALLGESSVTQRWVRGDISNFQYLMYLNTLAGRSYNDLSQYPVFPWVLADYESEELDLMSPQTFRDFSKPMGAQSTERLDQFMKRYLEWDDPTGETPPYMYGTHYSSAMIVLSYLVRLEPFTQQFLKLQGGHFDLADRMFHSVKDAWASASRNNMADVKELIPEFFYLPDFLVNSNEFDFGVKQNGVQLGDVMLPPWAKGDPREFIRLHRESLESDYVSAHLHEWIDLIFGYKQQGTAAVDARNLFHHLFYEGNVNFEAIDDPLTRNATIGFINNFGQIPSQLFKKPHPMKRATVADPHSFVPGATVERLFYHCLDSLRPPTQPVKELKQAVGKIVVNDKGVLFAAEQNKDLIPPTFHRYFAWGFSDNSLRLGIYDTDKSVCVHESQFWGEVICASCPNARTVVTGSTNTIVSVWEIVPASSRSSGVKLELRKSLYGHTEPISCVYASSDFGIIVSGSKDGSCIVWDLSKLCFIRQLRPHPGSVSAVCVNELTSDIASTSGTHLFLWSFSGQLIATVNTASSEKLDNLELILCVGFSSYNEWDSQNVIITGSNDGVVRMWTLEYVQVPHGESTDEEAADSSIDAGRACSKMNSEASEQSFGGPSSEKAEFDTDEESSIDLDYNREGSACNDRQKECSKECTTARSCSSPSSHDSVAFQLTKQSSSDSFVYVNNEGVAVVKTPVRLRKGFMWERRLIFRSKLSMHTAFERKDNPTPAAITAVQPSKDHKTLYVGDARGRVWAWSVDDTGGGGRADHWVQDLSRCMCSQCHQKFTLTERKHHCRNCGQIFCSKCSRFESEIKHLHIKKPVRVCQNCYFRLEASLDHGTAAAIGGHSSSE